eukprot:gnl/TRDRNA2_/TRDRNA2_167891_c1_seq1.p1 gnl/TRDRNA2_/TRDRNA2_167891_c1~~gnl/TRDRNA2_/TRDRNA2_167891_c1_seq1.p1  ORF type:complete len:139 (-),score=21.18 gnl/TRDRNA2_/TRDRNA2_167891_c1_seq1:35-391(-)
MLVLQLNDWVEHKAVLVTATFITITVLLLLMGGSTDAMLYSLKVPHGPEHVVKMVPYDQIHKEAVNVLHTDSRAVQLLKLIHCRILHPVLVGDWTLEVYRDSPRSDLRSLAEKNSCGG